MDFKKDEIEKSFRQYGEDNLLEGIENYNKAMTISKTVKFFERKNVTFTKTMIQNYVRIGLLPPPRDKRFYDQNHLIMLIIINKLKSVYALDEIKKLFSIIIVDRESFEVAVDMDGVYSKYLEFCKNSLERHAMGLEDVFSEDADNIDIEASFYKTLRLMVYVCVLKQATSENLQEL